MRKLFALLLVAVLALGLLGGAFADAFELHSGVTFGLSPDEVTQIEKEAGNEVSKGWSDEIGGKMRLAGIDDSYLYYSFSDNALIQMRYEFDSSGMNNPKYDANYENVSAALAKKYGESSYSSITGKRLELPGIYKEIITSGFGQHDYWAEKSWANADYVTDKYEEWAVDQDDGSIVFIHHCMFYDKNENGKPSQFHYHRLFYTRIDADTANEYKTMQESISDDL